MQRNLLIPLLPYGITPGGKQINQPNNVGNLLNLQEMLIPLGFNITLGLVDGLHPNPRTLSELRDSGLLTETVNVNILKADDMALYAGLWVTSDRPLETLTEVDSVHALQPLMEHCFSNDKCVLVQHPHGLQIIHPKLFRHVAKSLGFLDGSCVPIHLGYEAYMATFLALLNQQSNLELKRGQQAQEMLAELAASTSDRD